MPPTPRGVTRVVVEKPRINVKDYLWTGTLGLVTLAGQATLVVFITFFLLASGTTFRRKMVKLAGPRLSQKKITVQALDEVHEQMQRYLFVQMATSIVVGVLSGLAFYALGLNHSLVWGILAGITNLVPYLGAVVIGVASTAIGIVQFESIDRGLYIGAASFAIHTLVGNLLTPWWMGRASRMSAFAVFVGVLLFGWLWGVWGLLLGMPILMVVKSVCDRVEELKPVGELLGGLRAGRLRRRGGAVAAAGLRQAPDQQAEPGDADHQHRPEQTEAKARFQDGALGGAGDLGSFGERAEPGLAEALALLVDMRHQGRQRQRARRRVGRAGEESKRRAGRSRRTPASPGGRGPPAGSGAGSSAAARSSGTTRMKRACAGKRQGRGVGGLAVALDPVEDAAAELAPGILGARAALQANRRDPRAGGEAQLDIDQRQPAAEIEVERAPRLRAPCRRAPGSARQTSSLAAATATRPGCRRPRPRR